MTYTTIDNLTQPSMLSMTESKKNRFGMNQEYFLEGNQWLQFKIDAKLAFGVQETYNKDGFQLSFPEDCIENVECLKLWESGLTRDSKFRGLFKKGYMNITIGDKAQFFDSDKNLVECSTLDEYKTHFPAQSEISMIVTPYLWKQANGNNGIKLRLNQVKLQSKPAGLERGVCYL